MPKKFKTPFEAHVEEEIKILDRTAKMDKDLAKYGTKVSGGMVWSRAQLAKFFEEHAKRRK